MEAYLVWHLKIHKTPVEFPGTAQARVWLLLFRVLSSISEQVMYCPERLCVLFHGIVQGCTNRDEKPVYTLAMGQILDGLQHVHKVPDRTFKRCLCITSVSRHETNTTMISHAHTAHAHTLARTRAHTRTQRRTHSTCARARTLTH